jgi:hypothetical protein
LIARDPLVWLEVLARRNPLEEEEKKRKDPIEAEC